MASNNVGEIVYDVQMNVRQLIEGQQQVNDRMDRMERSADGASKSFSKLSGVAAALGSALSAKKIADYAEAWTVLNNKLVNSIKIGEDLAQVNERVFKIAQDSRSSIDGVATLYSRLERATREAGVSGGELADITTTITKAMAVSGATAAESEGALIQLSQALASGVLRGQEFNSMSEQAPALMKGLANSLGVNIGQLRKMAAEGKLTTDVLLKSFKEMGPTIEKEFGNTVATMGQSLEVANNNITKFVGESTTVKSAVSAFNSVVVTLSESLNGMTTLIAGISAVIGSRYVGALTIATAAQVRKTLASIADNKESLRSAEVTNLEAQAKARLALINKEAAAAALTKAKAEADGLRATNASTVGEVRLAEAEAQSIRINLAQIESEKALEIQRAKSQISEQGRIATATRMAQLQQAQVVLNTRLAQAEGAAATSRANAIAAADARVSERRITLAATTNTASIANVNLRATTDALTAAQQRASIAGNLLKGSLALVGGPAGAAMLAGAAIYYFYNKAQEARAEALAFADTVSELTEKLDTFTEAQLNAAQAKLMNAMDEQKDSIAELEVELLAVNGALEKYARGQVGFTDATSLLVRAMGSEEELMRRQKILIGDIEAQKSKLKSTNEALAKTEDILVNKFSWAGKVVTSLAQGMNAFDDSLPKPSTKETDDLTSSLVDLKNKMAVSALEAKKQTRQAAMLAAAQKIAAGAADEHKDNILALASGLSVSALSQKGMTDEVRAFYSQVADVLKLTGDLSDAENARKGAGGGSDQNAEAIKDLAKQLEVAKLETKGLAEEAEVLTAVQGLGSNATSKQVEEVKRLTRELIKERQLKADIAAAEESIPERKENKSYSESSATLKRQLEKNIINQQEYNHQSEALEANHQATLAEIRANRSVTPQQELAAKVDPAQALANEHAKKLALIQQFETQKGVITQRGLELMNAANREYEQQRIAATWQIWQQQSIANEALGSAIDSMGSAASNALTGIITGSMTAADALRSIGNTVLNSVINTFVQMGVEQVKAAMIGESARRSADAADKARAAANGTAYAASVSAQVTGMSAMAAQNAFAATAAIPVVGPGLAPAAAAAAAAAATGLGATAISTAPVAGARYNGGPVSAGSMYRVGEKGKPEIFQAGNGNQYMIPGDNGRVISNKDMQGTGGGATSFNPVMNIVINTTGGVGDEDISRLRNAWNNDMLKMMVDQSSRPGGMLQPRSKR
ncbi:tape measure protein [Pragia fontium]|uniref:tape measure protein n=1 Tax=Pragia fontium TaxID=82985 RepID=UPI000699EB44|nr:tape measure protein [Pragia fontium]